MSAAIPPDDDDELRRAASRTRLYAYLGLFALTISIIVGLASKAPAPADFIPWLLIAAVVLLFVIVIEEVLNVRSATVRISFFLFMLSLSVLSIIMYYFNSNPMFARFIARVAPAEQNRLPPATIAAVSPVGQSGGGTMTIRNVVALPSSRYALSANPACQPSGAATCANVCVDAPEGSKVIHFAAIMGEGPVPPEGASLSQCYSDGRDCPIGWSSVQVTQRTDQRICVLARNWASDRQRYAGAQIEVSKQQ